LVAAGQVVSLDEMVGGIDVGTGGEMGLGGFIGLMQSLLNLLALLDELLVAAGAIALLVGALFLGAYAWSREELLVVEVAGDDDIELPAPERDDAVADDLARAVGPGPATGVDDPAESGADPLR
jgi:hypothetical protein